MTTLSFGEFSQIVEWAAPYLKDITLLTNNNETPQDVKRIFKKIKIYFDEDNRPHDYDFHKTNIETIKSILKDRYGIDKNPELWI